MIQRYVDGPCISVTGTKEEVEAAMPAAEDNKGQLEQARQGVEDLSLDEMTYEFFGQLLGIEEACNHPASQDHFGVGDADKQRPRHPPSPYLWQDQPAASSQWKFQHDEALLRQMREFQVAAQGARGLHNAGS